ncbi:MAG TPA: RNA polymerase subunit sigma-24 [Chitinophagaceae bacterium]|nr:RNA polymerase subunit sigma-24 [Chitinophagaceae bacterium]
MTEVGYDTELLVRDCIANKRKAQETLYREFYAFAMHIALRYSRDEFDAADILSNAFVKIFKYLHHFDPKKGSLHGWIKKIVVNEGLDQIKSRERFSENVELETVEEPVIDNRALQKMGADELMEMIQKLPPATHAVFVLYAVEGYTHREIAEQLQISEGTSKWHLSEARKKLQQALLKT